MRKNTALCSNRHCGKTAAAGLSASIMKFHSAATPEPESRSRSIMLTASSHRLDRSRVMLGMVAVRVPQAHRRAPVPRLRVPVLRVPVRRRQAPAPLAQVPPQAVRVLRAPVPRLRAQVLRGQAHLRQAQVRLLLDRVHQVRVRPAQVRHPAPRAVLKVT